MKMLGVKHRDWFVGILVFFLRYALVFGKSDMLYISKSSLVRHEGVEGAVVFCKDGSDRNVTWNSPRHPKLGPTTHPSVTRRDGGLLLRFENLNVKDTGNYICTNGMENREFRLTVIGKFRFRDTPVEQVGEEGKEVTIRCEVDGTAQITWHVDGVSVANQTRYKVMGDGLLIVNANRNDSLSLYTCRALQINSGDILDRNITLKILHKPVPVYEKHVDKYGYKNGITELACEVSAEPPPTFTWSRNNRKPIRGNFINDTHKSVLQVLVEDDSLGDYQCEARNKFGAVKIDFTLSLGVQPGMPKSFVVVDENSTAFVLEVVGPQEETDAVVADLDPKQPSGFRVEYRDAGDNDTWNGQEFDLSGDNKYVLGPLEPDTEYQLKVATRNMAGLSEFTNITVCRTESVANTLNVSPFGLYVLAVVTIFGSRYFS